MSTTISHAVEIDRAPADVWSVLADTARYPDWNPFITRLSGDLEVGSRLEAVIEPPGGRPMTFRPTVVDREPGRVLHWRGRLLLPGIFDGDHRFELDELSSGRTLLTQSETFSGVLVPLLRSILAPTRLGFEQMNDALKARTEALPAARS
ncbi:MULTISPECIES: SRPBCC domain-containing protein [unclassified Isoptericola]|uniref:SRPBCC domain-containing protein n=1 Tax=unclassified Isoptericola TaxID=2623355 RepID=UPI00271411C5|nr:MULTISPECIES: SRPBCC domain-containing protein [unclassified Isoptericola]MDO8147715.1 SRPBCC domain-containing protein [Isoptericola sp. b515]MDO8149983.1 SRPBCC domain-containing protein [Isoptericola sp. b408]